MSLCLEIWYSPVLILNFLPLQRFLSQVMFNWMNQIFHLFVFFTDSSRPVLFLSSIYIEHIELIFSGNAMINSEIKLITTTTTSSLSYFVFINRFVYTFCISWYIIMEGKNNVCWFYGFVEIFGSLEALFFGYLEA